MEEVEVILSMYGVAFCSHCNGSVWQNKDECKYCFRCGSKLNWTKKENKTNEKEV